MICLPLFPKGQVESDYLYFGRLKKFFCRTPAGPTEMVFDMSKSTDESSAQDHASVSCKGLQTRLARAERNRASAARSRVRKKQQHIEFQERGKRAELLNRKLKEEVQSLALVLKARRAQLDELLLSEARLKGF